MSETSETENSNQSPTDTPQKTAEVLEFVMPARFRKGDVVRIKTSQERPMALFVRELAGTVTKVTEVHDRPHVPYITAASSAAFYGSELELMPADAPLLTVRTTITRNYEPKPPVKYWDIKEIAQ